MSRGSFRFLRGALVLVLGCADPGCGNATPVPPDGPSFAKAYAWPDHVTVEERVSVEEAVRALEDEGPSADAAMDFLLALDAYPTPGERFRAVGRLVFELRRVLDGCRGEGGEVGCLAMLGRLDQALRCIDGFQERTHGDLESISCTSTIEEARTVVSRWEAWYAEEGWRQRKVPWDPREDLVDPDLAEEDVSPDAGRGPAREEEPPPSPDPPPSGEEASGDAPPVESERVGEGVIVLGLDRPGSRPLSVQDAIREVPFLAAVEGDRVGYAGVKGDFYAVAEVLVAHGEEGPFRRCLLDRSPVARAMGLYGLVQVVGTAAIPVLRAHLGDRARFLENPGGCTGSVSSVGHFARDLLRNRHHLRSGATPEPVLEAEALLGVDLGILADDGAATTHDEACLALEKAKEEGRFEISWAALRRLRPDLPRVDLVKAVGRLSWTTGGVPFLLEVLRDEEAGREERLAAASALCRNGGEAAKAALVDARGWLDTQPEGALGTRFLSEIEDRERSGVLWSDVDEIRTWRETDAIADRIAAACRTDHPSAIWRLEKTLGLAAASTCEVKAPLVASLERIAAGLGAHTAHWCTWADAPYRLEALVMPFHGPMRPYRPDPLGEDARRRLRRLLRPHLR